jgi:hypothetical protein
VGAGSANTSGQKDSFFGQFAGGANTTGTSNSFFGQHAGEFNTQGAFNSFFGQLTGGGNSTGNYNTMMGALAGNNNMTGSENSFFGNAAGAGSAAITGGSNSFFGSSAGSQPSTGSSNSFFGYHSGLANTTGSKNTLLGTDTNLSAGNLVNATAIGANASVSQNNSLVLGSINGLNSATADTNVGIGTTAPVNILHLNGNHNDFALTFTNQANTAGRRGYRIAFDSDRLTFQSASDAGAFAANQMSIDPVTGNVGIGTVTPSNKLEVNGSVAGVGPYQNISDGRFKENVQPLSGALDKVLHLRGVSFTWRSGQFTNLNFAPGKQVGFIAQELEQVLPEAVSRDDHGYYRVAYSEVMPLLTEAIKEQQQTIARLQQETTELKTRNAEVLSRLLKLENSRTPMLRHPRRHRGR